VSRSASKVVRKQRSAKSAPVAVTPPQRLRVWWIPQVPGEPFHFDVSSPAEGAKMLAVLADYDSFQLENHIKGDYANVGGLEEFADGEWAEWHDGNGDDINDLMRIGCVP
jgi:superinfection exclusion protein gp17